MLCLQDSDSTLLPKSMMDVENVFVSGHLCSMSWECWKIRLRDRLGSSQEGLSVPGLKSLDFSPQAIGMSNRVKIIAESKLTLGSLIWAE